MAKTAMKSADEMLAEIASLEEQLASKKEAKEEIKEEVKTEKKSKKASVKTSANSFFESVLDSICGFVKVTAVLATIATAVIYFCIKGSVTVSIPTFNVSYFGIAALATVVIIFLAFKCKKK